MIVNKGREYYLIECKWLKEPAQAKVIRELYAKIENRVGIDGIASSMSGFTDGAIETARDYRNKRVILLFGPQDFEAILNDPRQFDALLDEKFNALVTKGQILCS